MDVYWKIREKRDAEWKVRKKEKILGVEEREKEKGLGMEGTVCEWKEMGKDKAL